jgi:uncharacterized protein (DUF4213/DUF364 family)
MNSPDGTRPGTMAEALAGSLAGSAREFRVAEARIGPGYTAVVLEDGRTGVAYTFRDGLPDGCSVFRGLRPLAGRSAVELLALLESNVALVTSASIINRTVDGLLDAASSCREVALLGASTPLLPQVFAGRVTLLSGVVVDDSRGVLQVVSEGGGMRQFGPYVRKVAVRAAATRVGSERSTTDGPGEQLKHVR